MLREHPAWYDEHMNITTALRKVWQGLVYACIILLIISVLVSNITGRSEAWDVLFPLATLWRFLQMVLSIV